MSQLSLLLAKNFPRSGDCVQKGEYLCLPCRKRLELLMVGGSPLGRVQDSVDSTMRATVYSAGCVRKSEDTAQSLKHGPAEESGHCVDQASLELQAWATLSPARESQS